MNLNHLVIEYLKFNDKLNLKKIGVIYSVTISAYFNKQKNVIYPPQKTYHFFEELVKKDEDFIFFISKYLNKSIVESIIIYHEFIEDISENIKNNQKYSILDFGILKKINNEIIFEYNKNFNLENNLKEINIKKK